MKFTMRDSKNEIVSGLENVSADNALIQRVPWLTRPMSLVVGETTIGVNQETFYLTRTE